MSASTSNENPPVICLGGCRRTLTSQKSRARGYGTTCWRKLHGHTTRRPRRTPPPAPDLAQPELPDIDQLEIWSP